MRRYQSRRSASTNILASKRIAVALCAAIAMVLGAMSVGATIHVGTPHDPIQPQTSGRSSAIITGRAQASASENIPSEPLPSTPYTDQEPLAPVTTQNSPPLLMNPTKPQIDVSLGPLNTLIRDDKIQLKVDLPSTTPVTLPVEPSATIDPPEVPTDITSENIPLSESPRNQQEEQQASQEPPQTNL